jgi:hypothetical protein
MTRRHLEVDALGQSTCAKNQERRSPRPTLQNTSCKTVMGVLRIWTAHPFKDRMTKRHHGAEAFLSIGAEAKAQPLSLRPIGLIISP